MYTTKNYGYAYDNLKRDLEGIKEQIENVLTNTPIATLEPFKEQIEKLNPYPEFQPLKIQKIYNNLKNINHNLSRQTNFLKQEIKNLTIDDKVPLTLKAVEIHLERYQMDLNTFLSSLRLDFLQIKGDINLPDVFGKTPLMYATLNNQSDTATTLLQKGADPFLKDPYSNSAFSLAISECNEELAKIFIKHKLTPEQWDNFAHELSRDTEGFFHYIAANMGHHHSELSLYLDIDTPGSIKCFHEAKTAYEITGGDSQLLCEFI